MFEYPLLLSVGSPEGSIFLSECDTFGFGARRRMKRGTAVDVCAVKVIRLRRSKLVLALHGLSCVQHA